MKRNYSFHKLAFFSALQLLWLLFGFPCAQAQTGQRFKQIDYSYDLISGKVNEVHYQASQPDAFYHRYEYDADNRIIKVFTSNDSIIWDNDARYVYYAHGPLARAELGDNNVQGMDYAYTLQGWIKGVNSNLLQAENDMGKDGLTGSTNSLVAKDAFGYTLNYHTDDYKPIDGPKWSNTVQRFEALTPGSDLMASRFDLFNGNISSMVTTIEEPKVYTGAPNEIPNILPQGTAYQYDQLNRLLEMKAFQNLDVATNTWQQGSTYAGLYHNAFKYDANGNILYQERADQNGAAFDKLTYQYKTDGSGKRLQNRLYHVNDGNANTAIATDDIEDQGTFIPSPTSLTINDVNNYRYDEIGNLKHDSKEGIDKIEWTVYGKIKCITRVPGNLRSDLEFQYDASGNRIAKIEKPRDAGGMKPPNDWVGTYYTRDAQGNVMGIYKMTAVTTVPSFKMIECNIYGSSRLGSDYTELEMVGALAQSNPVVRILGNKHFEGSNHLGNVLEVFSDRKIARDDDGDGVVEFFQSEVLSASDYSPFGVVLDGRSFGSGGRYGFNGKEGDDEVKGSGNQQDYGMRIYDTRLGRFLSVDLLNKKFPELSTYQFASNTPILAIDMDGLEACGNPIAHSRGLTGHSCQLSLHRDATIQQQVTQIGGFALGLGVGILAPVAPELFWASLSWAYTNPITAQEVAVGIVSLATGYEGPSPVMYLNEDFAALGKRAYKAWINKGIKSEEELGTMARKSYNAIVGTIDDEIKNLPTMKEKAVKSFDIRNNAKDFAREASGPENKAAAEVQ